MANEKQKWTRNAYYMQMLRPSQVDGGHQWTEFYLLIKSSRVFYDKNWFTGAMTHI